MNTQLVSKNRTGLVRGLTLASSSAVNMVDMIGVGPFITMPYIVGALGGPAALLGWILGALLAVCDGFVWSELGAALPKAGGSYEFLKRIYGHRSLGRLLSFLFAFQLLLSAPTSIATGSIGLSKYAAQMFPALGTSFQKISLAIPFFTTRPITFNVTGGAFVAVAATLVAIALLCHNIVIVGKIVKFLWVGVAATIAWVVVAGFSHFHPDLVFARRDWDLHLNQAFIHGLSSALLFANYDYWGYYNVCFLGEEVEKPEKTIPRAILISIIAVAVMYLCMNVSLLGVVDWHTFVVQKQSANYSVIRYAVFADMLRIAYGSWAARAISCLIMWTAFASILSLLLGYSRVLYAAGKDGALFSWLSTLHPRYQNPRNAIFLLGGIAAGLCFFDLADLVTALVVIRILCLFLLQAAGAMLFRKREPGARRPYRMPLYPAPALIAIAGFIFVLFDKMQVISFRDADMRYHWQLAAQTGFVERAFIFILVGAAIFLCRSRTGREWPFCLKETGTTRSHRSTSPAQTPSRYASRSAP
jgi:basic amino acid/polyamine antiporter, APA family